MTTPPVDPEKLIFVWDPTAPGRPRGECGSRMQPDLADYFAFLEETAPPENARLRLPQHTPDRVFSLEIAAF